MFVTQRYILKGKGNVHLITGHKDPESELWYSSTLLLTSPEGDENSTLCPSLLLLLHHLLFVLKVFMSSGLLNNSSGSFTPRKEIKYSLYRRLVGSHSQSRCVHKISLPMGFNSPTIQPIA